MRLGIRHTTRYRYEPAALRLALRLKLFPANTSAQRILDWKVSVNGQTVSPSVEEASGDRLGLWLRHREAEEVTIAAEGTVETSDTAGVLREVPDITAPPVWLRETPLTRPDPAIVRLAGEIDGETPLERLHRLSEAVHEAVAYQKDVTEAGTTAAEAMAIGAGVCQDQTHVFIAAAREMGVPARYVVGYILTEAIEEAVVPPAETHAWGEAFVPELGWTGFDPTHKLCPTSAYVRLCCGFDADDAAPIRGNVLGETDTTLEVDLSVAAQAQSQQQS